MRLWDNKKMGQTKVVHSLIKFGLMHATLSIINVIPNLLSRKTRRLAQPKKCSRLARSVIQENVRNVKKCKWKKYLIYHSRLTCVFFSLYYTSLSLYCVVTNSSFVTSVQLSLPQLYIYFVQNIHILKK